MRESYGSYLILDDSNVTHGSRFSLLSAHTNNEAEYLALIKLLDDPNLPEGAVVVTDSALVHGQLEKGWKVKALRLKGLHAKARSLMRAKRAKLVLVPRTEIYAKLGH